eukprot:g8308.t1
MTLLMTAGAARSLKRAANLARTASEPRYGPMHLLSAIVLDDSRAAEFLANRGFSRTDLDEKTITAFTGETDQTDSDDFDIRDHSDGDETVSEILFEARRCALRSAGESELGSEHLLWGILIVDSPAAELLRSHGIESEQLSELCGIGTPELGEALEVDFEIEWQGVEPDAGGLDSGDSPMEPDRALLRIVDAATNRAREGLRVLEDFSRFQLDDGELTRALKITRHEVASATASLRPRSLLAARDTEGDVGTQHTTSTESTRQTTTDLVTANFKRVQEALRTLEEFGKLIDPELGARFKQLRYRTYTLEKSIGLPNAAHTRLTAARLYLLVTAEFCELDTESVMRAALEGGTDIIQVREKSMPDRELLEYLHRARQITREADALLIVNDRPDLAVLCDADGVHVGQDELSVAATRQIVGADRLVGVSTHEIAQARRAVAEGADYLGVGPVFPSTTKHFDKFAGLDYVKEVAAEITLPWFAIGGIDGNNIASVCAAGATRVAIGRHITGDSNPAAASGRYASWPFADRNLPMNTFARWMWGTVCLAVAALPATAAEKPNPKGIAFFETKIRPVLVKQCYQCHATTGKKPKGGLLLDTRAGMLKGGESGHAVVPGKVDESLLIAAIKHTGDVSEMPPKSKLPDNVIADFVHWVKIGAPVPETAKSLVQSKIDFDAARKYWAFIPPKKHEAPRNRNQAWATSDIDRFILATLEAKGLKPVGDASRATLIRRVTFDLTGLPPTPAEVDDFVNDSSPKALEKVVDRLLASPRFGERWGRHWLDVARFAESTGKERNYPYPHAWRYRNYVIDSFNADKPYDQFIREQIAGDLLPAKNDKQYDDQAIATGFLALGPKSLNERNRLKFEMDVVDDQIDVAGRAVLGLTVACARCHDHKFDPIPTKDYYALAGIFRSTRVLSGIQGRRGVRNGGGGTAISLRTGTDAKKIAEHAEQLKKLQQQLRKAETQLAKFDPAEARKLKRLRNQRKKNKKKRRKNQNALQPPQINKDDKPEVVRLKNDMKRMINRMRNLRRNAPPPAAVAMGVNDGNRPIDSKVFIKGETTEQGEVVPRGFVTVVRVEPELKIPSQASGRLELAKWMTHRTNPTTARVMANRVWAHLFGKGIVGTVDNFGRLGERPTHPELLDHLAIKLMDEGWSVKSLIKSIVLSRVYGLSTDHINANYAVDPENRLLWRSSRRRLDAESIRDAILAVSGQLNLERPDASPVARMANGEIGRGRNTGAIEGAANRRSVYMPVVRQAMPAMLKVFDVADPSLIVGQRDVTTVPTQALFMMNSPFVLRQSELTAKRLFDSKGLDDADRIKLAYRLTLGRTPTAKEQSRVLGFITKHRESLGNEMLTRCAGGFGAVALSALLAEEAEAARPALIDSNQAGNPFAPRKTHFPAKAKNVIFLYMDGGVSQVDSFDPKPRLDKDNGKPFPTKIEPTQFNNIGNTLASPWKFKRYGKSGIPVSDLFPHVARHVDDLAVIRSMTSNFSEHTNANYFLHTGHGQQGRPSMGAWVGYGLGSECNDLPGFIVLNGGLIPPGGLDNFNTGFLPASYQGSIFAGSDPPVANVQRQEKSAALQRNKLALMKQLDQGTLKRQGRTDALEAAISNYELAARMQMAVPDLMDIRKESKATQNAYGLFDSFANTRSFARNCLIARRLVERGVRFVANAAPRTASEKRVDASIVRALKYLASEQQASGGWRIRRYRRESTAITSLAVMSFLAAGHVPGEGPYGERLQRAVNWVLDQQTPISNRPGHESVALVSQGSGDSGMYSHGISTLMLAEVVGMLPKTTRKRCRETLEKAIRLILVAQNITKAEKHAGGWRYNHTARDSDLSVTGWQLLALRAAKDVGCDVPKDNIDKAVEYVKKCRSRFGTGFTYQPGDSTTATRCGTGILCLEICGKHKSPEAMTGAEYLLRNPLSQRERWFYYGVYYCTVGMFKIGGKYWEATKSNTQALLLDMQRADGSWGSGIRLRSEQVIPSLILGLLLFVQITTFTVGIHLSSASHGTLFINTFVFWVAGFEHFSPGGTRLTRRRVLGLFCAAAGVVLILWTTKAISPEAAKSDDPDLVGDIVLMLSGFLLGIKILYTKHAMKVVESGKLIFWHDVIGVVGFAIAALLFESPDLRPFFSAQLIQDSKTQQVLGGLLYQGVVVAGFCFATQAVLLQRHSASKLSVFSFTTPLFGITFAVLLRGEVLSEWLAVAGIIVAVGILLVNMPSSKEEAQ